MNVALLSDVASLRWQAPKGTKTGAELNIPRYPVLQRMLGSWQASGWEESGP